MKLPNGFGSVYKLSGRRRRPWVARKTVGWNEKGQPKYKYIGYYETKKEALQALSAVNEEEERETATLQEVFEKWHEKEVDNMSMETMRRHKASLRALSRLSNKDMDKITIRDLESILGASKTGSEAVRMKRTILALWEYSFYKGYVSGDQLERVKMLETDVAPVAKNPHERFTQEEIAKMWECNSAMLLTLVYTGCRISEILDLKDEDIHLDEQFFVIQKAKTASGVREVPIADKLLPFWKDGLPKCFKHAYTRMYKKYFPEELERCGIKAHQIHDSRHTCASLLEEALIDDRVVKSILGHKRQDITGVYSHIDISVKLEAINKIC